MNYKEVFQLAQEKGFKKVFSGINYTSLGEEYALAELTLIQKWLRDEHKLHIYIDTTPAFDQIHTAKWKSSIKTPFQPFKWTTGKYYISDSYEEALLNSIEEALKLLQ